MTRTRPPKTGTPVRRGRRPDDTPTDPAAAGPAPARLTLEEARERLDTIGQALAEAANRQAAVQARHRRIAPFAFDGRDSDAVARLDAANQELAGLAARIDTLRSARAGAATAVRDADRQTAEAAAAGTRRSIAAAEAARSAAAIAASSALAALSAAWVRLEAADQAVAAAGGRRCGSGELAALLGYALHHALVRAVPAAAVRLYGETVAACLAGASWPHARRRVPDGDIAAALPVSAGDGDHASRVR